MPANGRIPVHAADAVQTALAPSRFSLNPEASSSRSGQAFEKTGDG
jgi:hypothetical protein